MQDARDGSKGPCSRSEDLVYGFQGHTTKQSDLLQFYFTIIDYINHLCLNLVNSTVESGCT